MATRKKIPPPQKKNQTKGSPEAPFDVDALIEAIRPMGQPGCSEEDFGKGLQAIFSAGFQIMGDTIEHAATFMRAGGVVVENAVEYAERTLEKKKSDG